jgi:hypothetical protein
MVLDSGRIVSSSALCWFILPLFNQMEFDSPKALLSQKDGRLRSLVDESGDKEALYNMASGKDL